MNIMGKPGVDGVRALGFWDSGTLVQSLELGWSNRWNPHKRLEEVDMEHTTEMCAGGRHYARKAYQ